jgi:hypothetical protein
MTGYQHQAVSQVNANQSALGQAAEQKGYRQAFKGADGVSRSFASSVLGAENQALDQQLAGKQKGLEANRASTRADLIGNQSKAFDNAAGMSKKLVGDIANKIPAAAAFWNDGAKPGGGGAERTPGKGEKLFDRLMDYGNYSLKDKAVDASADSALKGSLMQGEQAAHELRGQGLSAYKGNVDSAARQNAGMVAWEAKNQFAAHTSAMAGIAGMNTGGLSAGQKPSDMRGMAMMGELNTVQTGERLGGARPAVLTLSNAKGQAMYGGGAFIKSVGGVAKTHTDAVSGAEMKGNYTGTNWARAPLDAVATEGIGNVQGVFSDTQYVKQAVDTVGNNTGLNHFKDEKPHFEK